ncbi:DUF2179 domain-containing protein [Vagococcus lutrae]|uniref:UPF0316 protein PML95_07470 n=1 Tax=Vagococcus lutrae TaxID=81947 RepID=A0AAF0BC40_9ENTE|nr:DUF2179 domain-containing protein [Vagococcus lutrae]MDO5742668.1 DUF2179 domain-containing protein [Vagococcus sp.]MCO7150627.1 DUF2179 domain-containing protein [Vagococcus lutrae]MDT2800886.1 DUF2179 domain-containing protein [Vagococcus lutrae]MDT2805203.1 DUF2179 domain-containing protein [Vagococcus lutrae]MDT2812165.1 DUF2179 domain-containing protein [Vagococcus lutrae]
MGGKVVDLKLLLFIFGINFVYITLNTIRFMLTMKGYRLLAPLVSIFEITVYVVGLSMVLNRLDNPLNLMAYALGYGTGIAVGIKIEEKLALGYMMVTVILPKTESMLAKQLRDLGYGVTVTYGYGREGERMILEVLTSRKNERVLYRQISEDEPKAFVISHEPKYISGGFWTKRIKK